MTGRVTIGTDSPESLGKLTEKLLQRAFGPENVYLSKQLPHDTVDMRVIGGKRLEARWELVFTFDRKAHIRVLWETTAPFDPKFVMNEVVLILMRGWRTKPWPGLGSTLTHYTERAT